MAKEVQNSRSGEIKQTAEDLDEFLNRVRSHLTYDFFLSLPPWSCYLPVAIAILIFCRSEGELVYQMMKFLPLPSCLMMNSL